MNRPFKFSCFLALSLCLFSFGCKPGGDKKDEKPSEAKAAESTNSGGGVKIDPDTQKKIGLKLEAVSESTFTPELKCLGHVIDPAPLIGGISEITLAKASLILSQKEFDRVKVLRGQNNASDRALQTAQAAFEKDELVLVAARQRLELAWGNEVSSRGDLTQLAKSLSAGDAALVRVDFPFGQIVATAPQRTQLSIPSTAETIEAEFFGRPALVDLPTQGQGLLYLAKTGTNRLPVNATITATLPSGRAPLKGFMIPRDAVILHDGEKWFYEQSGESEFHREGVLNEVSTAAGLFVTNGIEAGVKVVTTGAQQLLSEELKSQLKAD